MPLAGQIIRASDFPSPLGLAAAPITTASNGTVTSGTTETPDAVLGTYTFTAQPGVRYRVNLIGRAVSMSIANDRFSLKFRYTTNGATPTASDSQVGVSDTKSVNPVTATNGAPTVQGVATFVPVAAGGVATTIKVIATWTRLTGTGTGTPVGTCEMFAEAIGYV